MLRLRRFSSLVVLLLATACSVTGQGPDADKYDARLGDAHHDANDRIVSIAEVTPNRGSFRGGEWITITGSGFQQLMTITIGGRRVYDEWRLLDEYTVEVRVPPGTPGAADVAITVFDTEQTLETQVDDGYHYAAIALAPSAGPTQGGQPIEIYGLGTNWSTPAVVTLGGASLLDTEVINGQLIRGRIPPRPQGPLANQDTDSVAIVVQSSQGLDTEAAAFTYQADDAFAGPQVGPALTGELTVTVTREVDGQPLAGAFVALGDPATTTLSGHTDPTGTLRFTDASLNAPVSAIATLAGYEATMFTHVSRQQLRIRLRPDFGGGGQPADTMPGTITGTLIFGSANTPSSLWSIVPEPRTDTEIKRAYVTTTTATPFSPRFPTSGFIDYQHDPQITSWDFVVGSAPGPVMVVAIAGLYDPAKDPQGSGVTGFEAFAAGFARGIVVGPGGSQATEIVVDVALDQLGSLTLDAPPPLHTPSWPGPNLHRVTPYIDCGGEGVVEWPLPGLRRAAAVPASAITLPANEAATPLAKLPATTDALAGCSYAFLAGGYTDSGSAPFSVKWARGFHEYDSTIADFLPVMRASDPMPDAIASHYGATMTPEGNPARSATYAVHTFTSILSDRHLRVFTPGDTDSFPLPNLINAGVDLGAVPPGDDISWTAWHITIANTQFDAIDYRHLAPQTWAAYAASAQWVSFPVP